MDRADSGVPRGWEATGSSSAQKLKSASVYPFRMHTPAKTRER